MVAKTLYDCFMVCDKSMFIGSQQRLGKQEKHRDIIHQHQLLQIHFILIPPQGGEVTCSPVTCPSATCATPDAPAPGQCCHTCQGI